MLIKKIISTQESAILLRRIIEENKFNTERELGDYEDYFGAEFKQVYKKPHSKICDAGAGKALALRKIIDVVPRKEAECLHAWGYTRPDDDGIPSDEKRTKRNFRYFEGDMLSLEADDKLEKGRYDAVLDVYGVFSYSIHQRDVLKRYHDILAINGMLFIHFSSRVFVEIGAGDKMFFSKWLKGNIENNRIKGFKVLRGDHGYKILILQKISDRFTCPTLQLTQLALRESQVSGAPQIMLEEADN